MTLRLFRILDISFGWLAFVIALIVYWMTVAPSVSFWDCGEFIYAAGKLEIGHAPGAPMYLLIARIFSLFASDPMQIAYMVNLLSVFSSAFTILFLYWTIAYFAKRIIAGDKDYTTGKTIAIITSSMLGAMVFTFSDSFWFSAVEAIPYPLSSLFTAFVFWAMLRWSEMENPTKALRWVLLIALLMGMSIGVHLLNLLTLPAIAMIFYYRNFKVTKIRVALALIASVLVIAIVLWGIIPGSIRIASQFELFTVNKLGLAYNSGFLIWAIITFSCLAASVYVTHFVENKLLNYILPTVSMILISVPFFTGSLFLNLIFMAAMIYGIIYLANKMKPILNFVMLILTFIMIGYSCYATIVIRSSANTPMNQNNPSNVFNLLYYLGREQYGETPLLKGQYYYSDIRSYERGRPFYIQRDGKYEIAGYRQKIVYNSDHTTLFPRMWSSKPEHIEIYELWGQVRPGQRRPNFNNNMKFFINYQLNWMYWRYFMWNFAGRQNDIQGHGNLIHGNWISGIPAIDNPRLGDQSKLPDYLKNNKANNKYYMLPLLFGLIGLAFQLFRNGKDWTVVMLLFVLTGIAIVVFLNQNPLQPRERDYSYVGSFYAFSIWVGLGLLGIYEVCRRYLLKNSIVSASIATLLCAPVPYIMASENWDDHDRSNRYVARDFGYNYLISCAPNSILFTYADNDTFPVWYSQSIEGVRPDVRVCCLAYFASDWYINQMRYAVFEAEPLPLTLRPETYDPTVRDYLIYHPATSPEDSSHISIDSLMNFIANDRFSKVRQANTNLYFYRKNRLFLRVDSANAVNGGTVKPEHAHLMEDVLVWNMNRRHLIKNEMMTLDMLRTNKWERPVHFTSIGSSQTLGLDDYFQNDGATFRLVPIKTERGEFIDTETLYDNLMNKFRWGNMADPNVYICQTIHRNIRGARIRSNFRDLAISLIREGDLYRAGKVLNKCDSILPLNIFLPGYFEIDYADAYYALGDSVKGDQYLNHIVNAKIQELEFFFSLDTEKIIISEYEIQMALQYFQKVLIVLHQNKSELYKTLIPTFNKYVELYERFLT